MNTMLPEASIAPSSASPRRGSAARIVAATRSTPASSRVDGAGCSRSQSTVGPARRMMRSRGAVRSVSNRAPSTTPRWKVLPNRAISSAVRSPWGVRRA